MGRGRPGKCAVFLLLHRLSFFLSIDTESIIFDHHLRPGGWLNFEFSEREIDSGRAIKNYLQEAEQRHAKTHTSEHYLNLSLKLLDGFR